MRSLASVFFAALLLSAPLGAQDTSALISPSPEGAALYFISPQDGEVVPATFTVRFGLSSMGVAPAGIDFHNAGHHHLLINVSELPNLKLPIPADEHHVHFGLGQTEAEITLAPGEHHLQLLLGNHLHIPHDPPVMSKAIKVVVE